MLRGLVPPWEVWTPVIRHHLVSARPHLVCRQLRGGQAPPSVRRVRCRADKPPPRVSSTETAADARQALLGGHALTCEANAPSLELTTFRASEMFCQLQRSLSCKKGRPKRSILHLASSFARPPSWALSHGANRVGFEKRTEFLILDAVKMTGSLPGHKKKKRP